MLNLRLISVVVGSIFVVVYGDHHDTIPSPYPFAVSLENFRGLHVGGGVLIAEDVVLTSAHNIDGVTALNVRLGSSVLGVGGQLIPIKKNCPISGYNFESRLNDVAVLKLSKKVVLNNKVALANFPKQEKQIPNTGVLSGWGYNVQGALDGVEVKSLDEHKCKHIYGETLPSTAFCVDYTDNKHSCLDAVIGNPFVADGQVFGVVGAAGACDLKGYPAVIARISSNKIQETINACN